MKNKVISSIKKYNMLSPGDIVYVGVSGGADSMCLLNILYELQTEFDIQITAVHINHGIRGDEAFRDEKYVEDFCKSKNIGYLCRHIDVLSECNITGESTELCARRLRYEIFEQISVNSKIATAHNLNDSVETYFLNTVRGTGLAGLTGIPAVRNNIIRPLIEISRQEIEQYCNDNQIDYITDSTNLTDDYSRNKIRHKILPVCEDINSSFYGVFLRNENSLKNDFDFICENVNQSYSQCFFDGKLKIDILKTFHKAIRYRVISRFSEYCTNIVPEYRHIEIIDAFLEKGGALNIKENFILESDKVYLKLRKTVYTKKDCVTEINNNDKSFNFDDNEIVFVIENIDSNLSNREIKKLSSQNYCDYDKISRNTVIRYRAEGDKFKPPFSDFSKKLKNLFNEKNILTEDRNGLIMITDKENVFWIEKIGVSDYARIDGNTKKICKINVRRNNNA